MQNFYHYENKEKIAAAFKIFVNLFKSMLIFLLIKFNGKTEFNEGVK